MKKFKNWLIRILGGYTEGSVQIPAEFIPQFYYTTDIIPLQSFITLDYRVSEDMTEDEIRDHLAGRMLEDIAKSLRIIKDQKVGSSSVTYRGILDVILRI